MVSTYRIDEYMPGELVETECMVCLTKTVETLIKLENNLNIVECNTCKCVYVNPRPTSKELINFYNNYYPNSDQIPELWHAEMSKIFLESHLIIQKRIKQGRILDIGGSYGHFLNLFDQNFWISTLVEPSETATAYAQKQFPKLRVLTQNFEDADLEPTSFDVVTSFYVLEHVSNPRAFIKKIYDVLKKDGIAIIRIPYTKPFFFLNKILNRPLLQAPMHLNDFSPTHLEAICQSIGFTKIDTIVGANRNSSDLVERIGANFFSRLTSFVEFISFGQIKLRVAGAYTYIIKK